MFIFCFSDTRRCLRYIAYYGSETHFVFIGDSRVKEFYTAFIQHLMQDEQISPKPSSLYKNLTYIDNRLKIKVDFIWSEYVSKQMVDNFR